MGHATAVAAALAAQTAISDEGLLENVTKRGQSIRKALREALAEHPNVGDVRGRGLFIGVEFVADKSTKTPFDPGMKLHKRIQQTAMQNGLLCYAMGGTVDGRTGDHVLLAPPYNINATHEAELVEKFTAAVLATLPGDPSP